ncbi:hypothetical protein NPIL_677901 [Nephila pilipes]|uniref:Uncharacterized protein n=1 Tax=Nephila pilipes TaxID=299642 RepID=A0A8X6U127_NEPPI|nr:hypothetical protein NPIL_677901 [Nephila pilipes]
MGRRCDDQDPGGLQEEDRKGLRKMGRDGFKIDCLSWIRNAGSELFAPGVTLGETKRRRKIKRRKIGFRKPSRRYFVWNRGLIDSGKGLPLER